MPSGDMQDEAAMMQLKLRQSESPAKTGQFRKFETKVKSDRLCEVEGIWEDDEGSVSFMATENTTKLDIDGLPHLTLIYDSTPKLIRMVVGDASMTVHKGVRDSEDVRAGLMLLSKSSVAGRRGKHLSKHLGAMGWNGKDKPCTYKLHMLLLALAKEHSSSERANSTAKWGPYGHDAQCPKVQTPDWECRKETNLFWEDDGPWVAPGSDALKGAHDSWSLDLKCRDISGKNPECEGMCGKGCDCWESICGSDYLCEYNPVCCAHDLTCGEDGFLSSGCLNSFVMDACSNEELPKYQ